MLRRTEKAMFPLVEAYLAHEGTKSSFCATHSIKECTFDYWRQKYEKKRLKPSTGFVELPQPSFAQRQDASSYILRLSNGHELMIPPNAPESILVSLLNSVAQW